MGVPTSAIEQITVVTGGLQIWRRLLEELLRLQQKVLQINYLDLLSLNHQDCLTVIIMIYWVSTFRTYIQKNNADGTKGNSVIGFFLSGELRNVDDSDPLLLEYGKLEILSWAEPLNTIYNRCQMLSWFFKYLGFSHRK